MSNLVIGTLFLLMLLAPCVIDLSGWWKTDPELEATRQAEEERAAVRAEAETQRLCEDLSLKPTYLFKEPERVSLLPAPGGAEELYALAMQADREALEARQAARQAEAWAMDAAARAAAARAEAAGAASALAARDAEAATETARAAFANYERVRASEVLVAGKVRQAA